jgi:hypothetical protein
MNFFQAFLLLAAEPAGLTLKDYAVAGFFSIASVILFIFLQLLGSRLFVTMRDSGQLGPKVFALILLAVALTGGILSCLISNSEGSLVLGFASGVLLWTGLGDIPEQMGWISPLSRRAVLFLLPSMLVWTACIFCLPMVPAALFGLTGFPLCVWGMHVTRERILARFGATSPAAVILILIMAAMAGGSLALGIVHGTPFSGIISGVVFAIVIWSAVELVWERGMANQPWKNRS